MPKLLIITCGFLLFAGADIPGSERLRSSPVPGGTFSSADEINVLPDVLAGDQQPAQPDASNKGKSATLQEHSNLDLIRYVSGEFAKATRNLPAGKDGFLLYVDKPMSPELLERAVATHGAAVHVGDAAQITKLEFRDHSIVVDVNGGGRGKKRWRDRIQIGRSEEHTSELQSRQYLVCRLLLEKKNSAAGMSSSPYTSRRSTCCSTMRICTV